MSWHLAIWSSSAKSVFSLLVYQLWRKWTERISLVLKKIMDLRRAVIPIGRVDWSLNQARMGKSNTRNQDRNLHVERHACIALLWRRIKDNGGGTSHTHVVSLPPSLLGNVHLTVYLFCFQTEQKWKIRTQTVAVIYLCFNMPYKATLFQN